MWKIAYAIWYNAYDKYFILYCFDWTLNIIDELTIFCLLMNDSDSGVKCIVYKHYFNVANTISTL